ncbi:MAG TPA: Hpt domain-containing protein, partial [Burkholderiales bacterium]|nr:Hpt domain-containing protein [Burkholderiales bacterium]
MANPDSTLLSWITAEVNQALSLVREQLARYANQRADPALLRACPEHLHQVSGALRMVGLAGATRFCEAIEAGFACVDLQAPREAALATLDRAVAALKDFVEGLERGQPNLPLRLFPAYRELAALGGTEASEWELFYPDLTPVTPAHAQAAAIPAGELPGFVQAQRARFQRGMLAWLRRQPAGRDDMGQALDALHRAAASLPQPYGLWWVALALLEALDTCDEPQWEGLARTLCNRLDFYLRDLAAGRADGEALLRGILYALAQCPRPGPRAAEVRRVFALDALIPPPELPAVALEPNSEWLEAALYDLHSRLEALKSSWVHYVGGEPKAAVRFRELVASFRAKARELDNQHLIKMLDAIGVIAKRLPDPYPKDRQYMAIEMASAFLLVESIIDHFTSPPADLEQQIVLLGGWLLDSADGKAPADPPAGLRGDLVQQIGALQLRAQVAREIGNNLRELELVLDAVGRDPARRGSAATLKPQLRQVHGALNVLGLQRAAQVASLCEQILEAFGALEGERAAEELDWLAEGLSSIGFYLDPCRGGREPAEQALDLFFQRYGRRLGSAPAEPAGVPRPAPAA